jgi:hypothetical protein
LECRSIGFFHHPITPSLQSSGQNGGGVEVELVGRADLHPAGHAPELARERGVLDGLGVLKIAIAVGKKILSLSGRKPLLLRLQIAHVPVRVPIRLGLRLGLD